MKTLTIANQKGGVGKTTLAAHLVWLAQERGHPVLLVDMDGQANSTRTFLSGDVAAGTLPTSALFAETADARPLASVDGHLWVIPADLDVNDLESLPLATIVNPAQRLADLSAQLPRDVLVVVDTPPTLGRRLIAALIAATDVISPLSPNGYALQGITDLQETILMVKDRYNPALRNRGLIANMVSPRSSSHRRMMKELRDALGPMVIEQTIGQRVAIPDAIDLRKPVWRGTKGESALLAAREMRAACEAILTPVLAA